MKKREEKTVVERWLFENPAWSEGYKSFSKLFGRPIGWLYIIQTEGHRLVKLDQKGHPAAFQKNQTQPTCANFLDKYLQQLAENQEAIGKLPYTYRCPYGGWGVIFPLSRLGQIKGFLTLCGIKKNQRQVKPYFDPFKSFLQSNLELVYKSFELQNFYETVHPRALALSTIHSVHRVMSSSVRLDDLIPRVGRLCAQVLKAQKCAIYLVEPSGDYLTPKFSFGEKKPRKRRIRIGTGIEGRVAETADFYISRRCIIVPFIEDDVVGIVELRDKVGNTPFTKTDLEILKTLSEQAVGAIKNAQLFEETEKITFSSIKTISELLALSYSGGDNVHLPIFGEIAFRIGKEMGLSGVDLTNLHRATYLIDAGHLGTPDYILHKKDRLTEQEYDVVKGHPHRGASILQQISSLRPLIPIILHHHERFDGTGYPNQLKGEEIPIGARIIAVVDSFTAMLSKRPYRRVKQLREAISEIKGNVGTQFDPKVVECFLKVIHDSDIRRQLKFVTSKKKDSKREIEEAR